MKALSINQPWAWCIVNGHKLVENRDWNTKFRGEFYIHAGKKFDKDGYEWIKKEFPKIPLPEQGHFEMGGCVGSANLINVMHESNYNDLDVDDKPWFFGEYGFMLDDIKSFPIKVCKGALGFFNPDFNSRYAGIKPDKQRDLFE